MTINSLTGRAVLSVSEFLHFANIGRTKFYQEVARGRLRLRKVGAKSVITASDAMTWVESLPIVAEPHGK